MPLDFRNTNTLWASVLVETLYRLGLQTAILCPGSRSAPLTLAFAQHPQLKAIPVLDERSASFFALGMARRLHQPVALVCTSGTAGANFYPAVIEARESGVPLLIFTADRPPELRHCHAGQAIDQVRLFGQYPQWQTELGLPEANLDVLAYLRQTLVYAWERSQFPTPGPVHLNLPFRDPLAPLAENWPEEQSSVADLDPAQFFQHLLPPALPPEPIALPTHRLPERLPDWHRLETGILVVGLAQPAQPQRYCEAIAQLAQSLGWPVLADALNPLRNFASLNPYLIDHYDLILRSPDAAQSLQPDGVIRLGELPTSKTLRQWLSQLDVPQWVLSTSAENFDPLHSKTLHLRTPLETLLDSFPHSPTPPLPHSHLKTWQHLDQQIAQRLTAQFTATSDLREPKIAWFLSQTLPPETLLFVANSTPVRDLEWFWQKGDRHIQPYFNRGANGIDGTLSTALGLAHAANRASVLLTGDLALLHDTNGFLLALGAQRSGKLRGSLTIILINNNGGGIFELLPIAQFDPPFEEFFATPHPIQFAQLCQTYGIEYHAIQTWEAFAQNLQSLPQQGIRLLELRTDRKADSVWRSQLLNLGREIPLNG